MRGLARHPERLTNVFPRHAVEFSRLCDVLTRDPCDCLTEFESEHREIEMSRLNHGPVGFTTGRCRIAHQRQLQFSRRVQKRSPRGRQCRLVKLRLLRRTSCLTRHDSQSSMVISFNICLVGGG